MRYTLHYFLWRRAPALLQPAVVWPGPGLHGRRVADGDRQHQHVHLRDRTGVHSDGARCHGEDARNHRLSGRRLHTSTR